MPRYIAMALGLFLSVAGNAQALGDAVHGEELYQSRCGGCHSIDMNRVGPAHKGVFGRKAGTVADFEYSAVVKKSKIVWSEKTLQAWLTNPEKTIPGQKMGYSVSDLQDRSDLVAYLQTVSKK